jgi:hypothetical protein
MYYTWNIGTGAGIGAGTLEDSHSEEFSGADVRRNQGLISTKPLLNIAPACSLEISLLTNTS